MRAVVQRCREARVEVEGAVTGQIGHGLTIFVGVGEGDTEAEAQRLAQKIAALRIFNNPEGRFDLSLRDVGGAALVISNFTVFGDARKGSRPNFGAAAAPMEARALYERFVTLLRDQGVPAETGVFAAMMEVTVVNDGPVTVILDVERRTA
jgi:D-tyrosyl-tRNA(Tyr) deacylase